MPNRARYSAEAFTYVLAAEQGLSPAQQSRFRFRPLTQIERLDMLDGLNWVTVRPDGTREVMPRAYRQARELVFEHLLACENFPLDGPLPWPVEGTPKEKGEYLDMLDPMDLVELGNELRYRAEPGLPESKPVPGAPAKDPTPPQEATVPN